MDSQPPFGQADLSNCERELIHLAGSVQPHGALLVLEESTLAVLQASANCGTVLGLEAEQLLRRPLWTLGGDAEARTREIARAVSAEPVPFRLRVDNEGCRRELEAALHRVEPAWLVLEVEPTDLDESGPYTVDLPESVLMAQVQSAVERFGRATTIGTLADAVVRCFRDLAGYDRVMVYEFDPDGHGKIIAEARDPRLETLLGHHYPATDIPQRARNLYLRTRVRVLVDVNYEPSLLAPPLLPDGAELDMSLCHLRSMSPLHLQYLKNMGVTATLVVSLVRNGALWGLVACHHYSPRNLRYPVRAAVELMAEVIATRLVAIEQFAYTQVALLVRRLEQRLVEATSTEGDWRHALLRNPGMLLQPLDATGAALFHDGEVLSAGDVPSTPELRALLAWVEARADGDCFSCSAVSRENPALRSLTPTASGVLAVRLSANRPDFLMWFRKEQLQTLTWAGDPSKPMVGNDPLELSPRRSFAAWSEIVTGTALPWTAAEIALAGAVGSSLVDIILQVHAVRLLIVEHQRARTRAMVDASQEAVVVADASGRILSANDAFLSLSDRASLCCQGLQQLSSLFIDTDAAARGFATLMQAQEPWRGELALALDGEQARPVRLRADIVPDRNGGVLGFMLVFTNLTEARRAAAARAQLEQSLSAAGQAPRPGLRPPLPETDVVLDAILSNASIAAMDIADAPDGPGVAPLLEEVEASARRASALYSRLRRSGDAG